MPVHTTNTCLSWLSRHFDLGCRLHDVACRPGKKKSSEISERVCVNIGYCIPCRPVIDHHLLHSNGFWIYHIPSIFHEYSHSIPHYYVYLLLLYPSCCEFIPVIPMSAYRLSKTTRFSKRDSTDREAEDGFIWIIYKRPKLH